MRFVAGVNNCGIWMVIEVCTQRIVKSYNSPEELYNEWAGNPDVDMTHVDEYLLDKSLAEHSGPPQDRDP